MLSKDSGKRYCCSVVFRASRDVPEKPTSTNRLGKTGAQHDIPSMPVTTPVKPAPLSLTLKDDIFKLYICIGITNPKRIDTAIIVIILKGLNSKYKPSGKNVIIPLAFVYKNAINTEATIKINLYSLRENTIFAAFLKFSNI